MVEDIGSPLDWMREAAPLVPTSHQVRYREIFETLANHSDLLHTEDDVRLSNERVIKARSDLVAILQEMRRLDPTTKPVNNLLRRYGALQDE